MLRSSAVPRKAPITYSLTLICKIRNTLFNFTLNYFHSVDFETDRIFKKFLTSASTNESSPPLPAGERLPPPSHMLPPPPLKASSQLRRQVMRKQYSDSIAMYYGQRQRRWRFITKQVTKFRYCSRSVLLKK